MFVLPKSSTFDLSWMLCLFERTISVVMMVIMLMIKVQLICVIVVLWK